MSDGPAQMPMSDLIARAISMMASGEYHMLLEHPKPYVGTSCFAPNVAVALAAELSRLSALVAELETYARDSTKAITGLTSGGSEFFGKRIGDIYTADLPYCVDHIRDHRRRLSDRLIESDKARRLSQLKDTTNADK